MSTTNLGRVQGAGFFYTTASSGTSISILTITPTNITPLIGDCIIFPNGDLRKVTGVSSSTITCGSVVASFKGPTGETGEKGDKGDKGDTGAQGEKGDTGAAAGFGTPTATVDSNVGTPSVTVAASGTNTAKVFTFSFKNLKGNTGDKGDKGDTGAKGDKGDTGAKGEKGDKGDPFTVAKVYTSVAEMNAGYSTDGVSEGGFVVIDTGNVEDEDNAKLYVKGASAYTYLTDLSGAQGMKGEKGDTGAKGEKGDKGDTGEAGAKGEKGDKGDTGEAGATPTLSINTSGELIATY